MSELPEIELTRLARIEGEPYIALTIKMSVDGKQSNEVLVLHEADMYVLPKKGIISAETYDALKMSAKKCRAYRRGMSILGYGANSERRLAQKLQMRGIDREAAEYAASKLKEDGCIDEASDACREAENCLKKLWGEKRIAAKLFEKGYNDTAIKKALEQLKTVNMPENCRMLIKKKYGSFPKERHEAEKATATLIRYGYTRSQIREAIKSLNN